MPHALKSLAGSRYGNSGRDVCQHCEIIGGQQIKISCSKVGINLQSLLEQATGCDIMVEFMGSDHAPVWLDLKIDELPSQKEKLPKLESKARFRVKGKGMPLEGLLLLVSSRQNML